MLFKNHRQEAAQELSFELEELDDTEQAAVVGGAVGYAKVKAAYSDAAFAKYGASAGGGIGNPAPSTDSGSGIFGLGDIGGPNVEENINFFDLPFDSNSFVSEQVNISTPSRNLG